MSTQKTLAKLALESGGRVVPLTFNLPQDDGVSIMNPSIINLNGKILVNLRCCNYTLYHTETKEFPHYNGYINYSCPSNQMKLITNNYIGELDKDLNLFGVSKVNMMKSDHKWNFWGLEDARLVLWNYRLALCGVRRDTTDNGEGRMEISEIEYKQGHWYEVNRYRLPMPEGQESYCEKNWVPIMDMPYYFVKWTNPTEIVEYDKLNNITKSYKTGPNIERLLTGIRGGTQVIPYKNSYISIGHSFKWSNPEFGRKNGEYLSHLIIWNKTLDLMSISDGFKMIGSDIEFQCGMCQVDDKFLITFSSNDNVAYLVEIDCGTLINELF